MIEGLRLRWCIVCFRKDNSLLCSGMHTDIALLGDDYSLKNGKGVVIQD
jgi:hypothetical protein